MDKKASAVLFAFLAALLYAINIPLSKLLLKSTEPVFMAAFLYLGAGLGMTFHVLRQKNNNEAYLTKTDLPYTIAMIVLDIIAPICLMTGLKSANAANASLLSNFEIAATAVIALLLFKELITRKMWLAILLITLSSILLSFEGAESLRFSRGSVYIIIACICWGFENNCTKMLSSKSAAQIVMLKGIFSGTGSFVVACVIRETMPALSSIACAMILGFVSYGLSIFFYVRAQNQLGAAKTSAFYAVAPFIGAIFSFVLLREKLSGTYIPAFLIMAAGTLLVVSDTFLIKHTHMHTHTIVHTHDGSTHEHTIVHEHSHIHLLSKEKQHTHTHV